MNVLALVKNVGRTAWTYVKQNPTKIITGAAVGGVVGTTAFAISATPVAQRNLENLKQKYPNGDIPFGEKVKAIGLPYIPTAGMGLTTIGLIIANEVINSKARASLTALCSASEIALSEYQNKITETFGKDKADEVKHSLNEDKAKKFRESHPDGVCDIDTGTGTTRFLDSFTGISFTASMSFVDKAVNDFNASLYSDGMNEELSELYFNLGMKKVPGCTHLLFVKIEDRLELSKDPIFDKDGEPVVVLGIESPLYSARGELIYYT